MTSISAQNILFDDFALLEKQIGRQQLMTTTVNANCDCASSPITLNANCDDMSYVLTTGIPDTTNYPSTSNYVDRDTYQVAPSVN